MTNEPISPVKKPASDESTHMIAIGLPLVGLFIFFVLGVRAGGEVADREILTLVRFISLLVLAMGIFTTFVVGYNYSKLRTRWVVGQISAGLMALSSGLLWSASAYGAGFIALMAGVAVITLLMFKEFGKRSQRRRLGNRLKEKQLS